MAVALAIVRHLDLLASDINREHKLAEQSAQSAVEHAMRCGELLIQAKAQVEHGAWLPWLADNFDGSERTAQRYIRVAKNPPRVADLSLRGALQALAEPKESDEPEFDVMDKAKPHVANNSGQNEWYTPAEYIEAARLVMGTIDLDPASSEEANSIVGASRFYSASEDGLSPKKIWRGNVWMNPPYSSDLIGDFCDKLVSHIGKGHVNQSIVLVNNATETKWFCNLVSVASSVCFPSSRIRFWSPKGAVGAPLQGQALIYQGGNGHKFRKIYSGFGWIAKL